MGGGNYNYICYKDASEIEERIDDVREMRHRLAANTNYAPAAEATEQVLQDIKALTLLKDKINEKLDNLKEVWRAVEYAESGDCSEKDVVEAVKAFIKKQTTN